MANFAKHICHCQYFWPWLYCRGIPSDNSVSAWHSKSDFTFLQSLIANTINNAGKTFLRGSNSSHTPPQKKIMDIWLPTADGYQCHSVLNNNILIWKYLLSTVALKCKWHPPTWKHPPNENTPPEYESTPPEYESTPTWNKKSIFTLDK